MTFFDTREIKKMDTVERDFYFQELSEANKKFVSHEQQRKRKRNSG